MAKKTINLGTGELTGDGESIRSAFDKINDNFDELYAVEHDLSAIDQSLIPDTDVAYDLGSATNRFRDIYLSGSTIDLGGLEISNVGGELKLDGVKLITQSELDVAVQNDITTNLTGSVFADDSTLLVDGVAGKIVGDVENSIVYTDVVYARNSDLYVNADDQASLYLGATNSQTIIIGASDSTIYLNGNQDSSVSAGRFVSPRGTDLNIATLDMTSGSADDVIIKGGETEDSDNSAFGGNVKINAGRNSNALQQHGDIQIGTEFTNGVTIGTYDGGDGFGNTVSLAGYTVIVGNSNNLSNIQLKGNVDFSDAKVSNLDVELSGDLTGSVFGDDSTVLVDGVNGKIVGPVDTASITQSDTGDFTSNFTTTITQDNQYTKFTKVDVFDDGDGPGGGFVRTINREIKLGANSLLFDSTVGATAVIRNDSIGGNLVLEAGTGIADEGNADGGDIYITSGYPGVGGDGGKIVLNSNADIFIGPLANTLDIRIGGGPGYAGENNTFFYGNVNIDSGKKLNGNVTGNVDGDVSGSVFADDSTLLVDGVNGVIPGYEKIRPVDAANAPPFVDFPETLNPDTHSGMELISTPTGAPRLTLPDGSYNGQTYFVTQNYQGGSDVEITVTNYYNKATEAIETVTVTGAAQFVWTGTWWTKIG